MAGEIGGMENFYGNYQSLIESSENYEGGFSIKFYKHFELFKIFAEIPTDY